MNDPTIAPQTSQWRGANGAKIDARGRVRNLRRRPAVAPLEFGDFAALVCTGSTVARQTNRLDTVEILEGRRHYLNVERELW